jgi:O-antigen/teichoic acid export membrane protein
MSLIPTSALQAQTKKKELHVISVSSSLIQIILVVLLTLKFGLYGAIAARILYRYVNTALSYALFLNIRNS